MTVCNPHAGCECQKKKYKPHFPSSVVMGFNLSGNSLRELHKGSSLFHPTHRAFPGLGLLPGNLCWKHLKAKVWNTAAWSKEPGLRQERDRLEWKGLGKEIHGGTGNLKTPMYTRESRRPWAYPEQHTRSEKNPTIPNAFTSSWPANSVQAKSKG